MSTFSETFKLAAKDFVMQLKRFHITSVDDKDEETCIVCMDKLCDIDGCKIHEHEEPARLICGHVIGMKCAATWFSQSQQCPMCRAKVWEVLSPKGGHWF